MPVWVRIPPLVLKNNQFMKTRETLEEEVKAAFSSSKNIAIQAATGVGKSKLALDLCKDMIEPGEQPPTVLIVVAEVAHIQNWKDEITKWSYDGPVSIVCYASLKKYRNTVWDVIIFDEAHHLGSELRLDIFSTITANHMLFLSATLKQSLLDTLELHCGSIKVIKMGLQDAFNADILPEPKIILVPLKLDNTHYNELIIEEWGKKDKQKVAECQWSERRRFFRDKKRIPNGRLLIHCTQQQKYDYYCEQFEYYKKRYMCTRNEAIKNKWLQWGSKRKTYLGLIKTAVVVDLLTEIHNKRFICFCTNIEQAEFLGSSFAVHSKKKECQFIIDAFNSKAINKLFAVGMLQEGVNLTDIEVGIIVQLDGEERSFIQRFGRTLRSDSPVQYIIYVKGTRDEEYLKNALENIDKKYIKSLVL